MNVLMIDDEPLCCELARELIRHEYPDAQVIGAGTCLEGLDKLKVESYDVVILDLNMPVLSGLDCLGKIREMNPELPVVILTGALWSDQDRQLCVQAGADDYAIKTTMTLTLPLLVSSAIERRKAKIAGKQRLEENKKVVSARKDQIKRIRGKLDQL